MKRRTIPWAISHNLKKCILFTGLLPLAIISCDKKEPEPPRDCGCDSDSLGYVKDVLGSYQGGKTSGGFWLLDSMSYNRFLAVGLCEFDSTLENSSDRLVYNYRVSGVLKKHCPFHDFEVSPSWVPVYDLTNPIIVKLKTPHQL